jgi:hypothetical protein
MCVEGCLDPDPDPAAPGYFFPGTRNQWTFCADGNADFDLDGLDDSCEYLLAHEFRPELSIVYSDYAFREPRWAAQWLDNDPASKTVRIAYLVGYWLDMGDGGTSETLCGLNPFANPCSGHLGDSEWVLLDVKYDPVSKHWYLFDAKYSAHTWHVGFDRSSSTGLLYVSRGSDGGGPHLLRNYMEFPDGKIGGYPRSYVADGKHANYPTDGYCDGPGGVGGADECNGPRFLERLQVSIDGNIGSRHAQLIDCVPSQLSSHPQYGSGELECYWINSASFLGWFAPRLGAGSSTAYGEILAQHFGF